MAISVSKKKSKQSKKIVEEKPCNFSFCDTFLFRFLSRIPAAILILFLVFVWSSSTTIISGNIVHVCVSSRKLNNLYCLSAGSQPNFDIPHPEFFSNTTSITLSDTTSVNLSSSSTTTSVSPSTSIETKKEIVEVVKKLDESDKIVRDTSDEDREDEVANAVKVVEEQMQMHRSWKSDHNHAAGCDGKGIFVYDLPSKFNKDLVGQCHEMVPWMDFCQYFKNEALGEPIQSLGKGWFTTHQYSLEPIFHSRVLKHPCRVYNENEAKLFYVPFYGGLDVLRWHFKNVSNDVKDILALELIKWLEAQKPWSRNSGKDHVFVLGKISWDFRRNFTSWGTRLLELDQMQNPIKLLIERQPWHVNDVGIPHPTYFHPQSDDDIISWQSKIISSYRKTLVSFAGAARPDSTETIRSILIKQCTSSDNQKCKFLDCSSRGCDQPESVIQLFMESEFCLQPPGDSPTRKSVFDSLISGCIPVMFDPFTAYYQYPWHLPEDHGRYSMFVDKNEVREMKVNLVEKLMKVPLKERQEMRRYIVYELLPGLVYGDPNSQLEKFHDAFSIAMSSLLERANRLE
ncbi:xyloglucan-specific galacturonosyltransferase 1 [Ziziphus jujuba]|uniref:Xyloglucan-specific galacturonosyltransferase 1 n=1 Tax=Ziziphus jujuba TaxID=326968 RepID=A0A6P6GKY6_ZIZJJ|nr:xyloglucan-specific galacturonosyltransferase 1 [Ziziphus jujuba]